MAKQKVRGHVEGHPVKQIHNIHNLARRRKLRDEDIGPFLEDVKISKLVLDEHWSYQAPAVLPKLAIRREDGVTQKGAPCLVKLRSLPKVGKLGCENCLDVLGLSGHQEPDTRVEGNLDAVWTCRRCPAEYAVKVVEQSVLHLFDTRIGKESEACLLSARSSLIWFFSYL
jgi:hypothetical protein